MEQDFFLPTYEYKVEYENGVPYDDFYIEPFPGMSGYFWYFPIRRKTLHILVQGIITKIMLKQQMHFLEKAWRKE